MSIAVYVALSVLCFWLAVKSLKLWLRAVTAERRAIEAESRLALMHTLISADVREDVLDAEVLE